MVPTLAAATQSQSTQQKVFLHCEAQTTRNSAGVEYVKLLVTNNTRKTIPEGKTINFLINAETKGSFPLKHALSPGQTASYQTALVGKVSSNSQAWIIIVGG